MARALVPIRSCMGFYTFIESLYEWEAPRYGGATHCGNVNLARSEFRIKWNPLRTAGLSSGSF